MLFALVLAPFVLAALVPVVRKVAGPRIGLYTLPLPILLFVYLLSKTAEISQGKVIESAWEWVPSLGLSFALRLDGWSLLFTLLVTGIGSLVLLYSHFYLGPDEDLTKFYLYLLSFMGSMLGVVLSANLLLTYVFWELTSFTSFLLIGFWSFREQSRYGAQKALLITAFGGFVMLAGFALIYLVTGSLNIETVLANKGKILSSPYYPYILLLILVGAFTKSAQVPFHIWLPNAMEAPTPISAFLHSATMVKAGLYLVGRLLPILGGTELWFHTVTLVGAATMVTGALLAVKQDDLKALLAYSTISQLGLIMLLFGIGTPFSTAAAVFHLFNHAAFKGALFMVVGIIDHETGTRDINLLGGLAKKMPLSAVITGLTAFSMAGVPPLAGFLSKELFYEATLETGTMGLVSASLPWIAVGASVFTFIYSALLVLFVFFGKQRGETPKHPHEAPGLMLVGPGLLAAITVIVGLWPDLFGGSLINPAVTTITGKAYDVHYHLWHGITTPLLMSSITVALGALGYTLVGRIRAWFKSVRARVTPNYFYDQGLRLMIAGSRKLTSRYMTGLLRDYIVYILATLVTLVGYTYLIKAGGARTLQLARINPYELIMTGLLVAAALIVIRTHSRMVGVLALGVVGFLVSTLWVVFRAPDLALTQLIVETIGLILFLLVFQYLPSLSRSTEPPGKKAVNLAISAAVGILMAVLTITALGTRLYEPISAFYVENSLKLGGGRNIVNVILVDFRGLDTMGEITVLGVAAMSVFALVKLKGKNMQ